MAIIKTSKGNFKKVPEGIQNLYITDVKLVPSGKPQKVEFDYEHESGATFKETFSFTHPVQAKILGQRCDTLYGGDMPEGTEIDTGDLPSMFKGKIAIADVIHKKVEKDGVTKTYVNLKYVKSYSEPAVEEDDGDDEL